MAGIIYVYVDTVFWVLRVLFFLNCSVRYLSMIVWTPAALGVLYAYVLYFCICTCSAQLSMFHMERCSKNMLIIIIKYCLHTFCCNIIGIICIPLSVVSIFFACNIKGQFHSFNCNITGFVFILLPVTSQVLFALSV